MNQMCPVTNDLNEYLEGQIVLEQAAKSGEKEKEQLITDQVDDAMGGLDEDLIIEVFTNEEFCWSPVISLSVINCDKAFRDMSMRDIQSLALQAYTLNNRIAKAARSYVGASK